MVELKNWGMYDANKGILIERIEDDHFLWQIKNTANGGISYTAGISKPEPNPDPKKKGYILKFGDPNKKEEEKRHPYTYYLSKIKKAQYAKQLLPISLCEKYCNYINNEEGDKYEPKSSPEIYTLILKTLQVFHGPKFTTDHPITAIFIMQTYVIPFLNSVFFMSIDATKGGGKTTLLEICTLLVRHGYMPDVTAASLPRLIEEWNLSIILDELDEYADSERAQLKKQMRQGQRKGVPYTRVNRHTGDVETYDTFAAYMYAFRSQVEDALAQRSVALHGGTSKDSKLPILNAEKELHLRPIQQDIALWGFDFLSRLSPKDELVTVLPMLLEVERDYKEIRNKLYKDALKDFSPDEKEVLERLIGRNTELAYNMIKLTKLLYIDLHKIIGQVMVNKQDNEKYNDQIYFEMLKTFLYQKIELLKANIEDSSYEGPKWYLKEGEFQNNMYYPKNAIFTEFQSYLKENNMSLLDDSKFNRTLRDLGFIPDLNWKNQRRVSDQKVSKCLIFNKDVCLNVGFDDEQKPVGLIIENESVKQ